MRLHWRRRLRRLLSRLPLVGPRWDPAVRRNWLLERFPKGSSGAEIGVWRGDFSAQILVVVRPRLLHLIDPWQSAADEAHAGTFYDRPQRQMDSVYESVLSRLADAIANGVAVVHRATSADAAAAIPDASLDWVYIDGDHSYSAVSADIRTYKQKVVPGGLVAGDDYADGGMFKGGVKRAVDEALASGELELIMQRDRQFVLRRPEAHG